MIFRFLMDTTLRTYLEGKYNTRSRNMQDFAVSIGIRPQARVLYTIPSGNDEDNDWDNNMSRIEDFVLDLPRKTTKDQLFKEILKYYDKNEFNYNDSYGLLQEFVNKNDSNERYRLNLTYMPQMSNPPKALITIVEA